MPKNKLIYGFIEWLSGEGRSGNLVVGNKSLLETLADDTNNKASKEKWYSNKRLHFVLIMSTIVMMFVSFVYYTVTFLNDVILFKTEMQVNEQGALNPKKAINCEYAMYLFNTSEAWANTGVRINEGDKYRINISGGTNTTLVEIMNASRENIDPRYGPVSYDRLKPLNSVSDTLLALCISKGSHNVGPDNADVGIGSMLYTIQPEGANLIYSPQHVKKEDIFKWNPTFRGDSITVVAAGFQKAKQSGVLYLSVNDLVFSEYNNGTYTDLNEQLDAYDKVMMSRGDKELSQDAREILKDDGSYFYKDNLGQILVSVEIIRNTSYFTINYPLYAYRDFEYAANDSGFFLTVVCFIWFFIKVFVFYAICMAFVWALICIPFYIGHIINKYRRVKA